MEEQIWNYIAGTLNEDEKAFVENKIATDEAWKKTYEECRAVDSLLAAHSLLQPSAAFSRNVMAKLQPEAKPASRFAWLKENRLSLSVFFLILVTGLFLPPQAVQESLAVMQSTKGLWTAAILAFAYISVRSYDSGRFFLEDIWD